MLIKEIGERALVEQICKRLSKKTQNVIIPPGDDAAAIKIGENILTFTTDVIVEGVHFLLPTEPFSLGWRAVVANVSDCLAMGSSPLFAVVALGLPSSIEEEFIWRLYDGMEEASKKFSLQIVGGHTSSSKTLFVCLSMIGITDSLIKRAGATPGEVLFLTAPLGGAAGARKLKECFYPNPPFEKLSLLKKYATSAIDVSDGFCIDLSTLLDASDVGAYVYIEDLPKIEEYAAFGLDPLELALYGGEDYQIIFSAPSSKKEEILKEGLYCIGEVIKKEEGRWFVNREGERISPIPYKGYEHFKDS